MNEKALQPVDLPVVEASGVDSLMARAIDRGVDVQTMERLMAMRRELRAEYAKAEFDKALSAFQAECPPIAKTKQVMNKDGRSVRYKYAPLEDIIGQVKGLLQKFGFSYSVDVQVDPQWVTSTCVATHLAGHSQTSTFKVPINKDAYMTDQQHFAAAQTFARRYAFCNAFGIMTADEDTDANLSPAATTTNKGGVTKPQPQAARPTAGGKTTEPKQATEKTRKWFVDELLKVVDRDTAMQWLIDKAWILPNEGLMEIPLDKVPTSRHEAADIISRIAGNVEEAPTSTDAAPEMTESFWDTMCPIPNKGQKRTDYLMNRPDSIRTLYLRMKAGDEQARRRLWGFAQDWEPSPWIGRDGKERPPSDDEIAFRKSLDEFIEWEKTNSAEGVTP